MKQQINSYLPVHDGRVFGWQAGCGHAEVSDFGAGGNLAGRVWQDSCDVGFYVRSHKTGARKLFIEDVVSRLDGDIVSWLYKSEDGFTIEIFND